MYKKILISGFFLASCVLSNAQASSATAALPAPDPNAPVMSFNTKDHDFGTIEQDGNGTYMFLFTNTGKEPLVIKEAHGSCGCTVPKWPHDPIAPNQQDTIKVTYDTHNHTGTFQKTVTITSNAKESPIVLSIKGKVNPKPPVPAFPTDPGNNNSGAPFSNNWDNQ
jgi:hypothetical protein